MKLHENMEKHAKETQRKSTPELLNQSLQSQMFAGALSAVRALPPKPCALAGSVQRWPRFIALRYSFGVLWYATGCTWMQDDGSMSNNVKQIQQQQKQ